MGLLAMLAAPPLLAQTVTTGSCGQWSTGFAQLIAATGAFGDFFYGPAFKIGMLVMLAISGIMLLADDGQLPRVAVWVLRAVLVIAFVGGASSFLVSPAPNCG